MAKVRDYLIYGLRDPITMEIRYVGKSSCGLTRPKTHCCPSLLKKAKTHVRNWIVSLLEKGLRPNIVVLQRVTTEHEANDAERFWISIGREALGTRLTNHTAGGDGVLGFRHSTKTKQRLREARIASWKNPEIRTRVVAAQQIGKRSPDVRRAARERSIIQMASQEMRNRLSEATRRALADPVVAERIYSARRAAFSDPEYRRKRSLIAKDIWARPDVKEKKRQTMIERGLWKP